MAKEIKITPPEGYEIDRENSTFDCIKFKPAIKRWRDNYSKSISGYVIDSCSIIHKRSNITNASSNYNLFATEKQAKSALAMARISQIMINDERFGGPITDKEWKKGIVIHTIERCKDTYAMQSRVDYYPFLSFYTPKQRDLFLEENEDLVKDYLMID